MSAAADPLAETLFRSTSAAGHDSSAAPVRTSGTRTRAGNAMDRTRGALLAGAARAVQVSGTKATMSQIAAAAGVAKATLYNHFRTREAVLSALVDAEVGALIAQAQGRPARDALATAAAALSEHPLRGSLARLEPATLAELSRVDLRSAGWLTARDGIRQVLADDGRAGADLVLRWLASHLVTPSGPAAIAADVDMMMAGLPPLRAHRLSLDRLASTGQSA